MTLLAVSVLLGFQNCGPDFIADSSLGSFSASSVCASNLEADFASSYHSFLKTNCSSCHTGAGPGNGAFANANLTTAFNAFLLAGNSKIDMYAQNPSHASGKTGPQNSAAIMAASASWTVSVNACKDAGANSTSNISSATYLLRNKMMAAGATNKDITWILDADLSPPLSQTSGISLTIAIRKSLNENGSTVYYLSNLRLTAGSRPVHIQSLMAYINGQRQSLASTFSRVDGNVTAGQTSMLSTATMIIQADNATPTDTLAFSINSLSVLN